MYQVRTVIRPPPAPRPPNPPPKPLPAPDGAPARRARPWGGRCGGGTCLRDLGQSACFSGGAPHALREGQAARISLIRGGTSGRSTVVIYGPREAIYGPDSRSIYGPREAAERQPRRGLRLGSGSPAPRSGGSAEGARRESGGRAKERGGSAGPSMARSPTPAPVRPVSAPLPRHPRCRAASACRARPECVFQRWGAVPLGPARGRPIVEIQQRSGNAAFRQRSGNAAFSQRSGNAAFRQRS